MSSENHKMVIADLKQLYRDCDTFFICSTQNQIVNFIPIVNMLEAKSEKQDSSKVTIYNITYGEEDERNKKWDENLIRTLNECKECTELLKNGMKNKLRKGTSEELYTNIELSRQYDQEDYREEIEDTVDWDEKNNNKTKKNIIWNLTGGQRSILLTVLKIIEEKATQNSNQKHTVLYMEGNTNRFVVGTYRQVNNGKGTNTHFEWNYKEIGDIYGWEHLTIKMAFGLAGFQAQCSKAIRLYKNQIGKKGLVKKGKNPYDEKYHKNRKYIKKFCDYYQTHDLVESLLITQTYKEKEDVQEERNKIWKQLKYKEKEDDVEKCKNKLEKIGGKNQNKLGYWLELMLYYELESIIENKYQDYFLELGHSVKLEQQLQEKTEDEIEDEEYQLGKFSEFDVVLLSKSGQVIIFECKSGAITSEVSKARMYTSYAASGVYGMPILVTPYLRKHIDDKVQNATEGVWGKMNTTRKAAQRAGMDIWCLDQLEDKVSNCVRR